MEKKSVYLRPHQLAEQEGLLEGREVGIAFQNFNEMSAFSAKDLFRKTGAVYLGLSAAIALGNLDSELAQAQLAHLGDSIKHHVDLCDISGDERPYRLWTEPGQSLSRRDCPSWVQELLEVSLSLAHRHLPEGMALEISQNVLTDPAIVEGWYKALSMARNMRPTLAGCQVWLTPVGGLAPGYLMGLMKTLQKRGMGVTISEFGAVLYLPSPPHPSQDTLKLAEEWRGAALTKWLLTTGLPPSEAPFWLPLDDYHHGPYMGVKWASLGHFDSTIEECYSRCARAGGPAGVGTDFLSRFPDQPAVSRSAPG